MLYRFDTFELDTAKAELRAKGATRPVEPQVFALLTLLIENRERLVSRDEILDKIWDGRVVSDAALSSRIKSARQALGDDWPYAVIADALPHELIMELSRLRWLFVTARGSSFRLRAEDADTREIGRVLGVRYCLCGTVDVAGPNLVVTVELVDTRSDEVVWADRFAGSVDHVHTIRADIRARILTALELQIPMHEANLARLTVTETLDAWSAYHLGLQHMYRFNRTDNAAATALFQQAVARDPGFARARADFFRAFPMKSEVTRARVANALERCGF